MSEKKQGFSLAFGIILVGILYQLLPILFTVTPVLDFFSIFFNAVLAGSLSYLILKNEFIDWFKHFSFKWILIGIPTLFLTSLLFGNLWQLIAGTPPSANSVNDSLTWSYVVTHIPIMILGEELLSIPLLYSTWKKWNWKFWQASLFCSILFAVWHLTAYDFNLLQILVTIIPSRLVLNYLFKKSHSIWVTWLVHVAFDTLSFLPILLLR
ncbi:CPBP family intramembrane glutamic endopeptidase [Enterococcus quebecensis]|uniref:CAAX protease n=1 Tax=Enterococcus quebecensis TaxID=903983 RepID=A0A1E5GRU7_9ENTE|nr:type II CAAX endopeptidase family protein [Enterococcus quebecensis]OEG15441.1 CAAX protease [Enterococcus quebecensis]OJG74061.1 caax amino protease family protein [Enterococcus quebecensis]